MKVRLARLLMIVGLVGGMVLLNSCIPAGLSDEEVEVFKYFKAWYAQLPEPQKNAEIVWLNGEHYKVSEILSHMRAKDEIGLKEMEITRLQMREMDFNSPVKGKSPGQLNGKNASPIFSEPDFETATHWGSYYVHESAERAAEFNPVELVKEDAIREKIFEAIEDAEKPFYFSGVGHGNSDIFTGQDRDRIFWTGDSKTKAISEDNFFALLSCKTGKELGPWMAKNGANFFGYKTIYTFVIEQKNYPNSYAKWFFDPGKGHFTFDAMMYKGGTCGEARRATYDAYTQSMRDAPRLCKRYLRWDRNGMAFFGDEDARAFQKEDGGWRETEEVISHGHIIKGNMFNLTAKNVGDITPGKHTVEVALAENLLDEDISVVDVSIKSSSKNARVVEIIAPKEIEAKGKGTVKAKLLISPVPEEDFTLTIKVTCLAK